MRYRLTIVLLLLNVALFGTLYYLEKSEANDRNGPGARLVIPPEWVEKAERIALSGPEGTIVWELVRQDRQWRLQQPVSWPANGFAVTTLLNQLRALEWESQFPLSQLSEAGQSLADYGLDKPRALLRLETAGERLELALGQPRDLGGRLYVQSKSGGGIQVVRQESLSSLTLSLDQLRSDKVLQIPAYEVRNLSVQAVGQGNVTVRLARAGREWLFEAPWQTAADSLAVDAALQALLALRVDGFDNPDPAQQGLDNPAYRLSIGGAGRREVLQVGRKVPNGGDRPVYYARLEDQTAVFRVAAAPLELFFDAQETLRERHFLTFDPASLSAVEIGRRENIVQLQKLETGAWQVQAGTRTADWQRWPADAGVMQALLTSLRNLTAERFVSDAPSLTALEEYGLNDPNRQIALLSGEARLELRLGAIKPEERLIYAKLSGQSSVYAVRSEILGQLAVSPLHYRARVIDEWPAGASLRSLRLARLPENETVFEYRLPESTAPAEDPVVALWPEARQKAFLFLVAFVRRFTVQDFLRVPYATEVFVDAETTHPWKLRLTVEMELDGGGESRRREIACDLTDRVGGQTQYGGSREANAIFLLPQPLIDALDVLAPERPLGTRQEQMPEPAPRLVPPPPRETPEPLPPTDHGS